MFTESLEKSQKLGEEGDVDGSMMFAQQADVFKQQHDSLKRSLTQPERTMTVCEVCGVFINSTDNEQRRKASLVSYTHGTGLGVMSSDVLCMAC